MFECIQGKTVGRELKSCIEFIVKLRRCQLSTTGLDWFFQSFHFRDTKSDKQSPLHALSSTSAENLDP